MGEVLDPTFLGLINQKYQVSFIMLVNGAFGFSVPVFIHAPQIKNLMKIIMTLLHQIEAINQKRD